MNINCKNQTVYYYSLIVSQILKTLLSSIVHWLEIIGFFIMVYHVKKKLPWTCYDRQVLDNTCGRCIDIERHSFRPTTCGLRSLSVVAAKCQERPDRGNSFQTLASFSCDK